MLPIRTILHPTDFSATSRFAFRVAKMLARESGARINVVHVIEPPRPVSVEGVLVMPPELNWDSIWQRLGEFCPEEAPYRIEHVVSEGDPAGEILRLAADDKADIIVMGTHGRTGLSRLLMGSVAEQVVRRAPCPVLTINHPVPAVEAVPQERAEYAAGPVPEAPVASR